VLVLFDPLLKQRQELTLDVHVPIEGRCDPCCGIPPEKVTDEPWHSVQQDVLLVLDPEDLEEPHAERLVGDELVAELALIGAAMSYAVGGVYARH